VEDWGVTVGVGVTVVDITVGKIGVKCGTMAVTVEGWFITVVRAWWSGSAEQSGQIQPPTSPRKNMDLRVGPGSLEQVEWTHLLHRLHWTEAPNFSGANGTGIYEFCWENRAGVRMDIAASKQEEYKETSEGW